MRHRARLFGRRYLPSRSEVVGWAIACVLGFWSINLTADDKATLRSQIDDLIQSLDASTLAERSHAERQLLEMGPDILPLMPASDRIESQSAREAIRRIRPILERRAARDSAAPSRVSLSGEFTVGEVSSHIQLQTKNRVTLTGSARDIGETRIRVNWDNAPFWECLDVLCQRASLRWRFTKGAASIELCKPSDADRSESAVQRFGPFRVAVNGVEVKPVVGDDSQRIVRVTGRLSIEPRLRPLFLSMAATNLRATDDEDRPLHPWNPGAKYEFPVNDGGRDILVQWDFRMSAETRVKSLAIRGRLQCQIAAATERVVFDQTSQMRGTIRRRGGVTVRLRHVNFETENDDLNADIGITVSYDSGGPAFESHRSWIFHNAVYLETKAGVRTDFTDFETIQQADGAIAVDYRWRKITGLGNQYLFVYEAPTLIIDVPIDVDLANIPISK